MATTCSECKWFDSSKCLHGRGAFMGEDESAMKECFKTDFQVGDVISETGHKNNKYEVVDIVLSDQVYAGMWCTKEKSRIVKSSTYILKDQKNLIYTLPFKHSIWWEIISSKKKNFDITKYPHICKRCGSPAYVGLNDVDCTSCGRY